MGWLRVGGSCACVTNYEGHGENCECVIHLMGSELWHGGVGELRGISMIYFHFFFSLSYFFVFGITIITII